METKAYAQEKSEKRLLSIRIKREKLKDISNSVRSMINGNDVKTINAALRLLYAEEGHTELRTSKDWHKDGYNIRKGEKAILLWGNPVSIGNESHEVKELCKYFPVRFLFSNKQVYARKQSTERRAGNE